MSDKHHYVQVRTASAVESVAADRVQLREDGHLVLHRGNEIVAIYAPGRWHSFHYDDLA